MRNQLSTKLGLSSQTSEDIEIDIGEKNCGYLLLHNKQSNNNINSKNIFLCLHKFETHT